MQRHVKKIFIFIKSEHYNITCQFNRLHSLLLIPLKVANKIQRNIIHLMLFNLYYMQLKPIHTLIRTEKQP